MLVPNGSSIYEFTEKKSRFIAEVTPILTPAEARVVLKSKKLQHPDANHVVHAFISGDQRQFMGMSDDGEPPGTSGKPVLEILKGRNLTNLILTVVRYFGGTKLGTGGLVRAYSNAAHGTLEKLSVKKLLKYKRFKLSCNYHYYEPIKKIVSEYNASIENELFETNIFLGGIVPEPSATDFKKEITEKSQGNVEVFIFDDIFQA